MVYRGTYLCELQEILSKIKQKYTDKNVDVIRHSLAGAIAETLGDDLFIH